MSAHHAARAADRIRRILADAIPELRDPRLGFVTLTDVKLSTDFQYAVAYVTVLAPDDENETQSIDALNHAVPYLRRRLARRAGLRRTPHLRFVEDTVIERGLRLEKIFDALRAERPAEPDEP